MKFNTLKVSGNEPNKEAKESNDSTGIIISTNNPVSSSSKNEFIVSLAGFNIGVEIAQALIIISVFGLLFLLKNWSLLNTIKKLVSFAIGLIALIWTFERMFSIWKKNR